MNALKALLRRHLLESRWLLGLGSLAFFSLAILTVWIVKRYEEALQAEEFARVGRRGGIFRFLGGPAMDGSTTALEVCWWNHPIIVMTVLSWAISRGAGSIAGEIDRGTIDVTLSRPISRSMFLASHVLYATLGLLCMVGSLIIGLMVGNWVFAPASPPALLTLLKPGMMLMTLGLSVFGYTVPFSALDVVRWRPTMLASAITLAGILGMALAPMFENGDWLRNFSVFQVYAPVTVAVEGDPLLFNSSVLTCVFVAGVSAAFFLFRRRDLPSNS